MRIWRTAGVVGVLAVLGCLTVSSMVHGQRGSLESIIEALSLPTLTRAAPSDVVLVPDVACLPSVTADRTEPPRCPAPATDSPSSGSTKTVEPPCQISVPAAIGNAERSNTVETPPVPTTVNTPPDPDAEGTAPRVDSGFVVFNPPDQAEPTIFTNSIATPPVDVTPISTIAPRVNIGSAVVGQAPLKSPLETLPMPIPVRPKPVAEATPLVVSNLAFGIDPHHPAVEGMIRLDVDCMLWLIPNRRNPKNIAITDLASGTGDTLGDERLNRHILAGARVGLGYWWTADNPWVPGGKIPTMGVETRFLFVGQRSANFSDEQSPTIVRPFLDLNDAKQSSVVVAMPGLANGVLSGGASESLWGAEVNVWRTLYYDWPGTTRSVEAMVGLRYLCLGDSIRLSRITSFVANPVGFPDFAFLAGNRIAEQESFSTQNQFIGGQVGIRGNLFFDTLILTGQVQLALGDTLEEVNIQGTQRRTLANGQSIVSQGALLALPSNIGRHYQNPFALMPEMGLKITLPINNHVTLGAGFSALYWSRIARPADQLDRAADITQIPSFPGGAAAIPTGLSRPAVTFNQSDMWLMGFMLSVEAKW